MFFPLGCLVLAMFSYLVFLVSHYFFLFPLVVFAYFLLLYTILHSHLTLFFLSLLLFSIFPPFLSVKRKLSFLFQLFSASILILFPFNHSVLWFPFLSLSFSFLFFICILLHSYSSLKNNNLLSKPTVKQRQKLCSTNACEWWGNCIFPSLILLQKLLWSKRSGESNQTLWTWDRVFFRTFINICIAENIRIK